MTKQLEMWQDEVRTAIEIYREGGGFKAVLFGGWCVGWGVTPDKAAANVIKVYEDEARLHDC